jgi:predicted MPP superfamily phosphohydrolase
MLPLGWMTFMYNGYVYGQYQESDTHVIVSSGFAGWGYSIRTQGVSEYVVVDLKAE